MTIIDPGHFDLEEKYACSRCLAPVDCAIEEHRTTNGDRSETWPVSPCCYEDLITEAEAERLREDIDEIAIEMAAERRLAA
jgi:hypothetical protein